MADREAGCHPDAVIVAARIAPRFNWPARAGPFRRQRARCEPVTRRGSGLPMEGSGRADLDNDYRLRQSGNARLGMTASRKRFNAARIRVFTVPSGALVRAAISVWDSPSK